MPGSKPTILVQLDTDPHPSVFDGVVAIDAGADHLLRHGGVTPEQVRDLVHGALFTRGQGDLHRTALFIGGSDVAAAEALLQAAVAAFFGPFRVSVLMDANGCNTTAAAAVLAAVDGAKAAVGTIEGAEVAVLGGTGPVGQRVARLLVRLGARVAVGSRSLDRAQGVAERLGASTGAGLRAFATSDPDSLGAGLARISVVVAAGAAGVQLLPESTWRALADLKVLIDLNAVPPAGLEGVAPTDRGTERHGVRCWGALGVGGTKMKIHKEAIRRLFTANDQVLDAEDVLALGQSLAGSG